MVISAEILVIIIMIYIKKIKSFENSLFRLRYNFVTRHISYQEMVYCTGVTADLDAPLPHPRIGILRSKSASGFGPPHPKSASGIWTPLANLDPLIGNNFPLNKQ